MSSNLGVLGGTAVPPSSPPRAQRPSGSGWRDPRLWIGVAIVAASVLVGVRVLAAADDTVAVWALADDVAAGDQIGADDLVVTRVRFADQEGLARYLRVEETLPQQAAVLRGLGAGELLPRSALGSSEDTGTVEISIPVTPLRMPPSVSAGDLVDVYVTDAAAPAVTSTVRGTRGGSASVVAATAPALSAVSVIDAPIAADGLGITGDRQLVLALTADAAPAFFALLDSLGDPIISIARR